MKKQFRSFEDARRYVHSLKLKTTKEWHTFCNTARPIDIPSNPNVVYKNKGWKGFGDWLGTETISNIEKKKNFLSYEKASQICKQYKIKSEKEFDKLYTKNLINKNIPSSPPQSYRKIWKKLGGWGGFLGTKRIANLNREFASYENAQKNIQKVKFNGKKINGDSDYRKWAKTKNRPINMPANPERTYKKQGTWKGWGDFLGTGRLTNEKKQFRPFLEARTYARSLKLKKLTQWYSFAKSQKRPLDIPTAPHLEYKNKGWKGYPDWLGTETISSQIISKNYLNWENAKPIYQKITKEHGLKIPEDWKRFAKTHKKLLEKLNLPAFPERIYTKERIERGLNFK